MKLCCLAPKYSSAEQEESRVVIRGSFNTGNLWKEIMAVGI